MQIEQELITFDLPEDQTEEVIASKIFTNLKMISSTRYSANSEIIKQLPVNLFEFTSDERLLKYFEKNSLVSIN